MTDPRRARKAMLHSGLFGEAEPLYHPKAADVIGETPDCGDARR